jgi:hypothetical protein
MYLQKTDSFKSKIIIIQTNNLHKSTNNLLLNVQNFPNNIYICTQMYIYTQKYVLVSLFK